MKVPQQSKLNWICTVNHLWKTVVINMHKTMAIYSQININAVKVANLLNP